MTDLLQRIERLSPEQRALLARHLMPSLHPTEGPTQDLKLVAYVVPADAPPPDPAYLKQYLKEHLPGYMVPASMVVLDALPRTPNGKVDVRALPDPDPIEALTETYVAPRTDLEATLTTIWETVLGVEPIGIHDNFFEIGGDSILSIRIVAQLRQAGLQGSPNQLFEHPTIAALGAAITPISAPSAEHEPATGSAPLTPIQHWFFEQGFAELHHWHQSLWLDVPATVTAPRLEQAFRYLVAQHDALRLRFGQTPSGWQQIYMEVEDATIRITTVDLAGYDEATQPSMLEANVAEVQASMDLAEAPLVRAVLVGFGPDRPQQLLLSVHHLVVDPFSWQIVLEDLQTIYRQLEQKAPVNLPARTTSYRGWAEALQTYAQSDALHPEQAFWLADGYADVPRLPVDHPGGRFTEATAQTCTVHLEAEETQALLLEVPGAYNTQIDDVLLTALVLALTPWTGAPTLLVGLERHGREEIQDGLDLSRTVGWFTAFFPVRLRVDIGRGPGEALKAVKEQLRQVPGRGVGYGILRYLSDNAVQDQLRALPPPEIIFNYTGRADRLIADDALFQPQRPIFVSRGASNHRSHVLEINAYVADDHLTMHWTFSTAIHRPNTIHQLARQYLEALQELIAHCMSPDAGGYTPSDFPEADLSQDELDKLLGNLL